jgi:hypothetical protein
LTQALCIHPLNGEVAAKAGFARILRMPEATRRYCMRLVRLA